MRKRRRRTWTGRRRMTQWLRRKTTRTCVTPMRSM
jgi:hypothetical protein